MAVHEAIHYLQDEAKYPQDAIESEAVAYLGDVAYRVFREQHETGRGEQLLGELMWSGSVDPIHRTAAKAVWGLGMLQRKMIDVQRNHLYKLELVLPRHPVYRDHREAGFDGVRF